VSCEWLEKHCSYQSVFDVFVTYSVWKWCVVLNHTKVFYCLLSIGTTPIFELDLHIGPNYTHLPNSMLFLPTVATLSCWWYFADSAEQTNTRQNTLSHLCGGPHYSLCLQNHFWCVDTHRQTDRLKTIPVFAMAASSTKFMHLDPDQITPNSNWLCRGLTLLKITLKFVTFWVILLTDKRTHRDKNMTSFGQLIILLSSQTLLAFAVTAAWSCDLKCERDNSVKLILLADFMSCLLSTNSVH